jgi:hypothetical protein
MRQAPSRSRHAAAQDAAKIPRSLGARPASSLDEGCMLQDRRGQRIQQALRGQAADSLSSIRGGGRREAAPGRQLLRTPSRRSRCLRCVRRASCSCDQKVPTTAPGPIMSVMRAWSCLPRTPAEDGAASFKSTFAPAPTSSTVAPAPTDELPPESNLKAPMLRPETTWVACAQPLEVGTSSTAAPDSEYCPTKLRGYVGSGNG